LVPFKDYFLTKSFHNFRKEQIITFSELFKLRLSNESLIFHLKDTRTIIQKSLGYLLYKEKLILRSSNDKLYIREIEIDQKAPKLNKRRLKELNEKVFNVLKVVKL